MSIIHAVILGLIQGVTEFLPVSSSGHLVIAQSWLGIEGPTLSFDVMVHFGTLVAVLIALKNDWLPIFWGVLGKSDYKKMGRERFVLLLIGSLPIGIIGVLFKDQLTPLFSSSLLAGWMLILTGTILWLADRVQRAPGEGRGLNDVSKMDALFVGFGQVLAAFPGLSRSGVTMASGLGRGLSREAAARFAFLLAIPAIVGATIFELPEFFRASSETIVPMIIGTVVAGISGYFSITFFLRLVRRGSFFGFSVYTWILGLLIILTTRG